jgi:3-hydroxyacyl-CoA dehydrogenase/enoyl-CoA hydratase/3-hydroxybutyryl-CoA epimerase
VALGKTPVVVKDSPGFVVNRVLMPYLNEAVLLVAEGVAAERIDREMRRFGMPMGPLELLDQVGLDVAAHVARSVRPALGDRFAPNPAFEQMCQKGWLGVKSGTGFYRHQGKKKRVHLPALALLRGEPTGPPPELASREARARMVGLMINEAAACLGEGLAENADTIDLALVFGTGWAPHRGGPLRYADDWGISSVVGELEDLARRLGPRFEPCPELRRRAESGEPFYKPAPAVVELGNA